MAKKQSDNIDNITWITADLVKNPFVSVDTQLRLYFSAEARNLLKADEVMIAYDHTNKRIIVGNPAYVRPANVKPHKLDRRGYASARPFVRTLGLTASDLPLRFEYVGKDYTVDGAEAFELADDPKAGRDGRL